MTYDEAKNLLGQQNRRLENTEGFEAWLDTTEHYINDIFKYSSLQAFNFRSLKSDFSISKITHRDEVKKRTNEDTFRIRAKQQITGLIVYLNEKQELELKEQDRERIKKLIEEEAQSKRKEAESIKQLIQPTPVRKNWFKSIGKQFMSLKIQAWSIIIGTWISGMFGMYKVGYDIGSSKFDKDKNEFYQKNQVLESTVKTMQNTIEVKSDSIKMMIEALKRHKN